MVRDLVDEECGGRFHVAVTATLSMLAKALVVVLRRGGKRRGERCVCLGNKFADVSKMVGSESFRACSVMRGHLTTVEHLVTVNAGMMMQKKFYGPPLLAAML